MEENLPVAVLGRSERQEVAGTRRFRRPVNDTVWDATSAAEPAQDPSGNELAEPRSTHRPGEETLLTSLPLSVTWLGPTPGPLVGTDLRSGNRSGKLHFLRNPEPVDALPENRQLQTEPLLIEKRSG